MNDLLTLLFNQSATLFMMFAFFTLFAVARGIYECMICRRPCTRYYNMIITFLAVTTLVCLAMVIRMRQNPTEEFLAVQNVWFEAFSEAREIFREAKQ